MDCMTTTRTATATTQEKMTQKPPSPSPAVKFLTSSPLLLLLLLLLLLIIKITIFPKSNKSVERMDCGLLWNFLQLPPTNTSTSSNTKNHNNKNHNNNNNHNTKNHNNTENDKNDAVKICIMPSCDDAQLTCREVSSWLEELGNLAERISRRENWGRGVVLVG